MVQEKLPYMTNDTNASIVAFIPATYFSTADGTNITVSISSLNVMVTVGPQYSGKGFTFPIDLSMASTGMSTLEAELSYAQYYNGSASPSGFATVMFDFYKVAPPSNGSVAFLDANTQAISVNGGARIG